MTKMIYVVYQIKRSLVYVAPQTKFGIEDLNDVICAVTLDREVACAIADKLDIKDGGEYWVDDIPVSHSLEEYKGQNNA